MISQSIASHQKFVTSLGDLSEFNGLVGANGPVVIDQHPQGQRPHEQDPPG
jgi:hypothetical protein